MGARVTLEAQLMIKSFETCSLVAYQDQNGRWTIGWGRARGVKEGDTCTQAQADAWFLEDIADFEGLVLHCLNLTPISNNQLSALVSFVFNVGLGQKGVKDGFQTLKNGDKSTMLKCLLARDYEGAAGEFVKWDKVGGAESRGILRRRGAELDMFLEPDPVIAALLGEP